MSNAEDIEKVDIAKKQITILKEIFIDKNYPEILEIIENCEKSLNNNDLLMFKFHFLGFVGCLAELSKSDSDLIEIFRKYKELNEKL